MTPQQFEQAVSECKSIMMVRAMKMLRRPEKAEEAVQESLLKAWRSLDNFEDKCSPRTWLYRITGNTCIDIMRQERSRGGDSKTIEFDVQDFSETSLETLHTATHADSFLDEIATIRCRLSTSDYEFALEYVDSVRDKSVRPRTQEERNRFNRILLKARRLVQDGGRFSKKKERKIKPKRQPFDSESYYWKTISGLSI